MSVCICISLRKASRRISACYDEALQPLGITIAQFSLLRMIQHLGPVSLTRLGEATELERSTVGRNVRLLQKKGFAAAADSSGREARIVLAPGGAALLAEAVPLWEQAQDRLSRTLGSGGVAALNSALEGL